MFANIAYCECNVRQVEDDLAHLTAPKRKKTDDPKPHDKSEKNSKENKSYYQAVMPITIRFK